MPEQVDYTPDYQLPPHPRPSRHTIKCAEIVRTFDGEFTKEEYETRCHEHGIAYPVTPATLYTHNFLDIHYHYRVVNSWTPEKFIEMLDDDVFGQDCYGWHPDIRWDAESQTYKQYVPDYDTYTRTEG